MQKKSRFNLDKVISVNLRVTLVWFVGLSLMMVNLLTSSNDIIILTLLLVSRIWTNIIFRPLISFSQINNNFKDKLLAGFESDFSSKTTIPLSSDCDPRKSLRYVCYMNGLKKLVSGLEHRTNFATGFF